jgi:mitochondrial fission protein ELM1
VTSDPSRIWVLADPRAGTAAQAIGIAERLGLPFRTLPLAWGAWARIPWPFASLLGLAPGLRAGFAPPWPRLVVAAGRRSAPVGFWLQARGARLVQCMRAPGAGRADLQILGQHDDPPDRPNILPILGAAHRLTPAALAAGREAFPAFGRLPAPRVALLIGGPVRAEGLAPALAADLGRRVAGFAGSELATTSRRTGAAATAALSAALEGGPHHLHAFGAAGPNPLHGLLGWADAIVVTGDSVSMLSEALISRAPLFVAPLGDEGRRHLALHASLYAAGQARPISAAPAPFQRAPCDETARVAAEIRARGFLDV